MSYTSILIGKYALEILITPFSAVLSTLNYFKVIDLIDLSVNTRNIAVSAIGLTNDVTGEESDSIITPVNYVSLISDDYDDATFVNGIQRESLVNFWMNNEKSKHVYNAFVFIGYKDKAVIERSEKFYSSITLAYSP